MKRHLQAVILKSYLGLSTRLKTSSFDFPFSWLVFCRFLGEIVYNLNHDRFKWSFKLFLVINLLSKATFSLHILCRLWMTILPSLLTYWLVKVFWSWDVFYTPGWLLTGIVVIFAKNQQKKIWEAHWFNGTSIYRTLLENELTDLWNRHTF